jgi:GH25 family lysozyme M1 (1,4-beta-N-acetylmuramidase)
MQARRLFADQYELNTESNLSMYADAGHVLYACKATEGAHHYDVAHAERARRAHKQGLTVMHYHYCRPDQDDILAEVKLFQRIVERAWQAGDIVALDFESAVKDRGVTVDQDYIERMWTNVKAIMGHTARVYGSTSFLETYVRRGWLKRKPRWQAQYGDQPGTAPWGTHWWAWQQSDGLTGPAPHELPGMGECDVSLLNPTTALRLSVRTAWRRRRLKL